MEQRHRVCSDGSCLKRCQVTINTFANLNKEQRDIFLLKERGAYVCSTCLHPVGVHSTSSEAPQAKSSKIISFEESPLEKNSDRPRLNQFFKIPHLYHGRLLTSNVTVQAFARKDVVDLYEMLWQKLGDPQPLFHIPHAPVITGPPGCGKSWLIWCLAYQRALLGETVVWLNYEDTKHPTSYAVLWPDKIMSRMIDESDDAMEIIKAIKPNLIVFDGFVDSILKGGVGEIHPFSKVMNSLSDSRRAIIVQSPQYHASYRRYGTRGKVRFYFLKPWTFLNYKNACMDMAFLRQVSLNLPIEPGTPLSSLLTTSESVSSPSSEFLELELEKCLRLKYEFAGLSARWMFDVNIRDLKELIQFLLREVSNPKGILLESCSNASHLSVQSNQLFVSIARTDDQFVTVPVSNYVSKRIFEIPSMKFVKMLSDFSLVFGDPCFDGLVFEWDFRYQVLACYEKTQECLKVAFVDENNVQTKHEEWQVTKFHQYHDSERYTDLPKDKVIGNGNDAIWLYPDSLYNGSWDFAVIDEKKKKLQAVQITVAQKHGFVFSHFKSFEEYLINLGVKFEVVEVIFLIPSEKCRPALESLGRDTEMQLKSAEGSKRPKWNNNVLFYCIERQSTSVSATEIFSK